MSLWWKIKLTDYPWAGRALRPAFNGKGLVLNRAYQSIIAVEISPDGSRGRHLEVQKQRAAEIRDHQVYGDENNQVAALSKDGVITLMKFEFDPQSHGRIEGEFRLNLLDSGQSSKEFALTLSVCPMSRYFFVNSYIKDSFSRVIILELSDGELSTKASIDMRNQQLRYSLAAKVYGYFSRYLLFSALTCSKKAELITFVYDTLSNSFKELKNLRRQIGDFEPRKIDQFGQTLYSSGSSGRLVKIRYFY